MVSDVERWAALHKSLSVSGPQFPNSKHEPPSTAFQAQPLPGPLPYSPVSILNQLPSTPETACESSLRWGQATWNPWAEVWSVACTPSARPRLEGGCWEQPGRPSPASGRGRDQAWDSLAGICSPHRGVEAGSLPDDGRVLPLPKEGLSPLRAPTAAAVTVLPADHPGRVNRPGPRTLHFLDPSTHFTEETARPEREVSGPLSGRVPPALGSGAGRQDLTATVPAARPARCPSGLPCS